MDGGRDGWRKGEMEEGRERGKGIINYLKGNRGGSRIECRGVLSIPLLLTSFPHTTCYTKKK